MVHSDSRLEKLNLFQRPSLRKLLFASLYFSEGAPIGFIWLALPTQLRAQNVPIEKITWLTAILVLPWTFKFVWAPLVDAVTNPRWTLRHSAISAQVIMVLTLIPLLWIDATEQFGWLAAILVGHALAAATQDVAIDALCISATDPSERGAYNAWMQTGMLAGRACLGGGALVMIQHFGQAVVIGLLLASTGFSMVLLILSPAPPATGDIDSKSHWEQLRQAIGMALRDRNTWWGLLFALIGGAAFKSLEVFYGPFLIDRGISREAIGWFSLGPMIVGMILGSLLGGGLTDRIGSRSCVSLALVWIVGMVSGLALNDLLVKEPVTWHRFAWLAGTALGIGVFTASSYTMFMNLSQTRVAATQFSAFMGATNGCESWSSYASGKIISQSGYPAAMLWMCLASLLSLPLLWALKSGKVPCRAGSPIPKSTAEPTDNGT